MIQKVFITYNDEVLYEAPHIDHQSILLAATGATLTMIQRYAYDDIVNIDDVSLCSHKKEPYRIFGRTGAVVWQTVTTKGKAIAEFHSRCSPYIEKSQRAYFMEMVKVYRKDDIAKAINAMYGDLR